MQGFVIMIFSSFVDIIQYSIASSYMHVASEQIRQIS